MSTQTVLKSLRQAGSRKSLRAVLHGGAAVAVIGIASFETASAGPDACVAQGFTTYICSGNQSDGVFVNVDFPAILTTLIVNDLTQDITVSGEVSAIRYESVPGTDISITIDTGDFQIIGEGPLLSAIRIRGDNHTNVSLDIDANILLSGSANRGLYVDLDNTSEILADFSGSITTAGNTSDGIRIVTVNSAGGVNLTSLAEISTNGNAANGINIRNAAVGSISIDSAGTIVTSGDQSNGIRVFEQGLGDASIAWQGAITTSGDGSHGIDVEEEDSGDVSVFNQGPITTSGIAAGGVVVTEGGAGGVSVASSGTISTTGAGSHGVSLVEEGDGDAVAAVEGDITTSGSIGYGISILEYDAGNAVVTHEGNISVNTGAGIRVSEFGLGDVVVTSQGNITVAGGGAVGIIAAGREGGNVEVVHMGDITSSAGVISATNSGAGNVLIDATGDFSISDSFADAIYGGASAGAGNVEIAFNGAVSTSGDDESSAVRIFNANGDARVDGSGSISTQGDESVGINMATTFGVAALVFDGDISTQGNESQAVRIAVADGSVVASVLGAVSTEGLQSAGVYVATTVGNASVAYGGELTTTGNLAPGLLVLGHEGLMVLDISGSITTEGEQSSGVSTSLSGAGVIAVNGARSIATSGLEAHGVSAFVGGAGDISIAYDGDIRATGVDAHAVLVNAPGTNVVSLNGGGIVQGGSGSGAGVMIQSQAAAVTTINNGADLSALSGLAISGGAGDETVNNSGTITGDVLLESGANAFNNLPTGALNSSNAVTLGAGGMLTNDGTVNPGGAGAFQTTMLDGDYMQSAGGVFSVDVGDGGDLLQVGGAADLAGVVEASLNGIGAISQEVTILSAAGGVTDNGLSLQLNGPLNNSFLLDVELLLPNPNAVVLSIDFGIPTDGLNSNQTNVAEHLLGGAVPGGGLQPVLTGLASGVSSAAELQGALNQLLPEIYLNTEKATLFAAEAFADSLFNCGRAEAGGAGFADGKCVWLHAEARSLDGETTAQHIGFDEDVAVISAGAQYTLTPELALSVGVNYESGSLETSVNAETNVDRIAGGVSVQYQPGPLLLSGVAFAGTSTHDDVRRPIAFGDFAGVASGEQDIFFAGGEVRAAYHIDRDRVYLKPAADIAYSYLDTNNVTESGAGAANLDIEGKSDGVFSASAALEIGADFEFPSGLVLRPFVKPGVSFIAGKDEMLNAAFVDNAPGAGSFQIRSEVEDVYADIEAGVILFGAYDVSAQLSYIGRFAKDTAQQGVMFRASYQF